MTQKKNILFICGPMNITTQMHQIAQALPEYAHYFTPFSVDGFLAVLNKRNRSVGSPGTGISPLGDDRIFCT